MFESEETRVWMGVRRERRGAATRSFAMTVFGTVFGKSGATPFGMFRSKPAIISRNSVKAVRFRPRG